MKGDYHTYNSNITRINKQLSKQWSFEIYTFQIIRLEVFPALVDAVQTGFS